jgi:hypothetical protein
MNALGASPFLPVRANDGTRTDKYAAKSRVDAGWMVSVAVCE